MLDKQKQLQARIILSNEIIEFQKPYQDVVLALATGLGKSFNFMNICMHNKHDKILFVVPQNTMIPNFIADVKKLGFDNLLDNMEIICYASLKKYVGKHYDIIGYDECHALYSDARMEAIKQITADKRILLSATLDEKVKAKLATGFTLNTYTCDYVDGVRRGILPQLQMEIHHTYLDDVNKVWPHKFKDAKESVLLTALEYYNVLNKKVKDASDKYNNREEFKGDPQWLYNRMVRAGGDRQAFLGNYKTEFLRKTVEDLKGERMVVFCGSKDQAILLGGGKAVHSDNTSKVNNQIIADFNAGLENEIYARNLLTEGHNLFDTKYAIVCGLGSKELRGIQITGRILRHDSPVLIILVVAGTVDEKFLEKSFKVNIYGERL